MRPAVVAILILTLAPVFPALATEAGAQNFTYFPDNNLASGGCNSYPFRSSPVSWRYQMLVPSTSLPSQPVRITDIAFAACSANPPLFEATQFQLRIAHTTIATLTSTFANNFGSPPVAVYDAALKWQAINQQWQDIGLQLPFDYDGSSSLIVEIRYRGRVTASSSIRSNPTGQRVWNNTAADPYAATTGTVGLTYGLKTRLTYASTVLSISGSPSPGGTVTLDLIAPADAGEVYQIASSLGTGPILIGQRTLALTPDDLMVITIFGYLPSVFVNYTGVLNATGRAQGKIVIPNNNALKGVRLHTAYVTLNASAPQGIKSISNTASFSIQ